MSAGCLTEDTTMLSGHWWGPDQFTTTNRSTWTN